MHLSEFRGGVTVMGKNYRLLLILVPRFRIVRWLLVTVLFLHPQFAFADKAGDDFNLGVGLYRSQRYDQSADTFEKFLTEFPEHPRTTIARLYYGLSLSSLEKYAPARDQHASLLPDRHGWGGAERRLCVGLDLPGGCHGWRESLMNARAERSDIP